MTSSQRLSYELAFYLFEFVYFIMSIALKFSALWDMIFLLEVRNLIDDDESIKSVKI